MIWFSLQMAKAKPAVLPNEKRLSGKKHNNQTIACELALSDGRKKGFHFNGKRPPAWSEGQQGQNTKYRKKTEKKM